MKKTALKDIQPRQVLARPLRATREEDAYLTGIDDEQLYDAEPDSDHESDSDSSAGTEGLSDGDGLHTPISENDGTSQHDEDDPIGVFSSPVSQECAFGAKDDSSK